MARRGYFWPLLALVAALASAHLFLDFRARTSPIVVRRNTLAPEADGARQVRVEWADRASMELERVDGRWRIVAPFAAEAERQAVLALLDQLAFTPILDAHTEAQLLRLGRTRAEFGVDAPRATVCLDGGVKIAIGATTPAGDGVYVSRSDEPSVYTLTNAFLAAVRGDVDGFRRRALLAVAAADVLAFDLKRGSGSFLRFEREGDGWRMLKPQPAAASAQRVRSLLDEVLKAAAADFVWPQGGTNAVDGISVTKLASYGLDPENAVTLTLKCRDGLDRYLAFGGEADNALVYALVDKGAAVVRVEAVLKARLLGDAAAFVDERLFPLEPAQVETFSLTDGEVTCQLSRGEEGRWRLDVPFAAPADGECVAKVLKRALLLRSADRDPAGVVVAVGTNSEPAAVARAALLGEFKLEDLRSRQLLEIVPAEVRRLQVTAAGAETPVAVVCDPDTLAWSVESSPVPAAADAAAVQAVLETLTSLRALRTERLKVSAAELGRYGLAQPRLTLAVDRDGTEAVRRNLLLGGDAPDGVYATLGASEAVFVLERETADRLLRPLVKAE